MSVDRWSSERDPALLGPVVHGPAIVARSEGIAMAVRCIFAQPGGLEIDLVLSAVGVQAEAAVRQSFPEHVFPSRSADETAKTWRGGSEPDLVIELDGRRATAYPQQQTSSGGEDTLDSAFLGELRVTVAELPTDGLITLTASWPQAGLAAGTVTLTLSSFAGLEDRVVRLPS